MWGFGLGGAHSLELIQHVALLGILRLCEVPVHIVYAYQWTGDVVTVPDALEEGCFGGKPRSHMEVLNFSRQAWGIINVVGILPCCMVGIEGLNVR